MRIAYNFNMDFWELVLSIVIAASTGLFGAGGFVVWTKMHAKNSSADIAENSDRISKLETDLQKYKIEVAEKYMTREEMHSKWTIMQLRLDALFMLQNGKNNANG